MKVIHRAHPGWGVGHVRAVLPDERRIEVLFPSRAEGPVVLSDKDADLVRHQLKGGDAVLVGDTQTTIDKPLPSAAEGHYRYLVRSDGKTTEVSESALTVPPPRPGPIDALANRRLSDVASYVLRSRALQLDMERRADALGALFSSRVMVKPHQVAVVQRVLSAREPRFVLADEVGLGKTIEAGLVLAALTQSGLAQRVLIVAPAHLTVQWLAEMFHKFNILFTMLDAERIADERKADPSRSPWNRYPRIIASLEMLARGGDAAAAAASADPPWDLVIVDEAHHLRGAGAYEALRRIAANTWGLLLLTATPMQLDPEEYYRLLSLVESIPSSSLSEFQERMARQEDLSALARALVEGKDVDAHLRKLRPLLERDEAIRPLIESNSPQPQSLLAELARGYSLSARLIRNRRATVGGFERRRLRLIPVRPGAADLDLQRRAREALTVASKAGKAPVGAALASILRRLDSSPPALSAALSASGETSLLSLATDAGRLAGPDSDAKLAALLDLLAKVDRDEPRAKVLLFAEARETLEYLSHQLGRAGITTVDYHGGLSTVQRDRNVARFRDPEGPRVLLSSELGGEGRNFQFCHHLVNYDLAWSPATLEQRVGRVDRIGQRRPVEVYVFRPEGTLAANVADLMVKTVRVFEETVGGLDAVLEETETELIRLAVSGGEFEAYAQALSGRIAEARARIAASYDPLLDLRSFDQAAVQSLVERAGARLAVEDTEGEKLEEALVLLSRSLEERLEEAATEIALRIGIVVDTEEQVDAFQCAFHLGHALKVEALPGIDVTQERSYLGTFWRDTAVEQEEIEHFTTGHPLVESLFAYLRDGELGRAAALRVSRTGFAPARALAFTFLIQPPVAEDLEQGGHVASRQAMRYVDTRSLIEVFELGHGAALTPRPTWRSILASDDVHVSRWAEDDLPLTTTTWAKVVRDAGELALARAERDLERAREQALTRLDAEREDAMRSLDRWLRYRAATPANAQEEKDRERAAFERIAQAIRACRLELDSACFLGIES